MRVEEGSGRGSVGGREPSGSRWSAIGGWIRSIFSRIWNGKAALSADTEAGRDLEAQVALETGTLAAPVFPDTRFGRFDRRFTAVTRWLSYLAGLALLSVVIISVLDVLGWKLFRKPLPSTQDFVTYMNVVLVFLAVAYVQTDRGSTAIELLQNRFPLWLKISVRTLSYFLGFGCCMYVVYRGYFLLEEMWKTHDSAAGVWKFPLWPFQFCLMVGSFFLGWAFVVTGIRDHIDFRHRQGRYAPSKKAEG